MGFSRLLIGSCSWAALARSLKTLKKLLEPLVLQHLRKKCCCGSRTAVPHFTVLEPQQFFFRKSCKTNGFSNILSVKMVVLLIGGDFTPVGSQKMTLFSLFRFKIDEISTIFDDSKSKKIQNCVPDNLALSPGSNSIKKGPKNVIY